MARTAGYSSRSMLRVQSPVAAAMNMGRGAIMAANSTLLVSRRRPGAFSHTPPPCMMKETMLAGAENWTRSSTAVSVYVWVAPPEAPVAPIILGLTPGRDSRKSMARMAFHNWRPNEPNPQSCSTGFSPKSCGVWMVSL